MIFTNSSTNYTNIDTQKSVHFAVPRTGTRLKNASDLYMKYKSYAEHYRPCTRLSGVNWQKKKTKKKNNNKKKKKKKNKKKKQKIKLQAMQDAPPLQFYPASD